MSSSANPSKRHGNFILVAARALYLAVAVISILIALIALIAAGVYEVRSLMPAKQVKVPAVYQVDTQSIDLSIIDAHFAPPTNISFSNSVYVVSQALGGTEIFGHFEAVSANRIALPPDDVDVIGGPDAAKFTRAPYSDVAGHSGLQPSPALVSEVNQAFKQIKSRQTRSYRIKVIMRDRFGNISAPADIVIKLHLAPPGTTSQAPDPELTPLEALALDIAHIVDPSHGTKYVDAFQRAKALPARCGERSDSDLFVANYRHAFNHIRGRLSASTLEQFYLGVCDGWNDVRAKVEATTLAKEGVETQNAIAAAKAEQSSFLAILERNRQLVAAGGAFIFFMFISLLLAFLAIEDHTRAMRSSLEDDKTKTP